MKASDVLVQALEAEGVDDVFGVPGEELEDLLFSLRESDVRFVPTRHEQGAAFMANVHGRLTGEAGVCLGTLGPGATNLLTGVADANLDKAPLVAVTGQGSLERLHKESHQALDIVSMFRPVTKWTSQVPDADIVHESVRKAFKVAELEKPGATHIEFPEDVAGQETDRSPIDPRSPEPGDPDEGSLDRMYELLRSSERPLIIAGNGAVRTEAWRPLRELVDLTGIPVVSTYMGKGAIPDSDPRSLFTLDSGDHREAKEAIGQADLIVTVGYDIAEHDPASWNPDADATVVHVDSQAAEVYEEYHPDVEIVADIPSSVEAMVEACEVVDRDYDTGWYGDLRDHILEDVQVDPDPGDPFTVAGTLPLLREAMEPEDVLISDVGNHKMRIAQNFPTLEANTCIISNGLASMGISVPGGVAADLAVDANVVAATGDGGFLMNAAEVETAKRLDLGFTVLVWNDRDYGLISKKQRDHRGESWGTELENPDLVQFAESFGLEAVRPKSWDGLTSALEDLVPSDELALVEVPLERQG